MTTSPHSIINFQSRKSMWLMLNCVCLFPVLICILESSQSSCIGPSPQSKRKSPIPSSGRRSINSSVESWLDSSSMDMQGKSTGARTSRSGYGRSVDIQVVSVPWSKMPPMLTQALDAEERPDPRLRREMVRIIVDDLNKPGLKLPRTKELGRIAQAIVNKYPKSFADNIGGMVVGSGYESLLKQLVNKVDNATRPNPNKRKLSTDSGKSLKTIDSYTVKNNSVFYSILLLNFTANDRFCDLQ